jgi:hypothetical protein
MVRDPNPFVKTHHPLFLRDLGLQCLESLRFLAANESARAEGASLG